VRKEGGKRVNVDVEYKSATMLPCLQRTKRRCVQTIRMIDRQALYEVVWLGYTQRTGGGDHMDE
jgi:hypothetical protein